ncbi:MAG: DUF4124 domain-containing protein [Gammaproteobacteria bacterium]|nr:DUF4124 domain-containing protein [Gammaproteobacteria bacterium]
MGSAMRMRVARESRRKARAGIAVLAVALFSLAVFAPGSADFAHAATKKSGHSSSTGKVYRWVDNEGVVHFGDQIPPEYAPLDRQVLNQLGIAVRTEQGTVTEEERAAERQATAEKDATLAAAHRDEVLLNTYLSVEEIEVLRDRRIGLIEDEITVTTNYLQSLRENLAQLQAEASKFKPYSTDPDAEPIDEKLAKELSDTVDSIALYEKTLADTRMRQDQVVMAFEADISRFRELKSPTR